MILQLFPRKVDFFALFEKQVNQAVEAAKYFKEVVSSGVIGETEVATIHAIEKRGDDAAHAIINSLNQTFITPFDREDLHSLAIELDDISDMLYTIVSRLKVYKISGVDHNLVKFAAVIEESVMAVEKAIKGMRDLKHLNRVSEVCVEINRLENIGDAMRDDMLTELFENEKDFIAVLKWKEIYQEAETVLDICEDVAHLVQSLLLKQA
jgi:uncharacterized protein Yka (UPF0111/DUF47 family)